MRALVSFLLLPVLVAPSWSQPADRADGQAPVVERYMVNAQYRGGVKKGFSDLGSATVRVAPLGAAQFGVKVSCAVSDPESKTQYRFEVDMDFSVKGGSIRATRSANRYSANAREYSSRVEKVIPFIYLVKYLQPPGRDDEPTRTWRFAGSEFTLRYTPTERHDEASLYEGDSLVGKFFILRERRPLPLVFEKFRVPAPDHVILSFVRL